MKIDPKYRPAAATAIGYTLAICTLKVVSRLYPEPMCGPGIAALCFLLFLILAVGFFFISLFRALDGQKRYRLPLALHVLFLLGCILIIR